MNVTFINIKFINSNFTGNGRAIWNNYAGTKITIINSTFRNNTVVENSVIYSRADDLNICGYTFAHNNVTNIVHANQRLNSVISNCNFINNERTSIRTYHVNYMVIINCNFINNTVYSDGGAILTGASKENLTIYYVISLKIM